MNYIHLKYAVEIEKAGSVSKAAENLYMGQPNLSRAIKELEEKKKKLYAGDAKISGRISEIRRK